LPDTADVTGIQADQKDGILTRRIPKKEEAKPSQIQVKQCEKRSAVSDQLSAG